MTLSAVDNYGKSKLSATEQIVKFSEADDTIIPAVLGIINLVGASWLQIYMASTGGSLLSTIQSAFLSKVCLPYRHYICEGVVADSFFMFPCVWTHYAFDSCLQWQFEV